MTAMDQARAAQRVPAAAITGLIEDALAAVGLPASDAGKVAELMTEADLTGADLQGARLAAAKLFNAVQIDTKFQGAIMPDNSVHP